MIDKDIMHMKEALKEAQLAELEDEVPIGCVIVKDDKIVARGHNQRDKSHDPLGHAEIVAIKKASEVVNDWQLVDCELYVTIEPCIMCSGAIIQSRIKRVVYGAPDIKGGAFGSSINVLDADNINHRPEVIKGVLEEECTAIIKNYFKKKRNK
jgi:tRNA(adenine34) deaminase